MTYSSDFLNSRQRKANKIKAILQDHLGPDFHFENCLDIGCREGTVLNSISDHFEHSFGIDLDVPFLHTAQTAYRWVADGMCLPLPDETFDVILCAQVYEHVQNVGDLFTEIYRTLKPGGIVFFSGPNRRWLMEEHYQLPLLSWLPKNLAHRYLRATRGIAKYEINPHTSNQLRRHLKDFTIIDYTQTLLQNPENFALEDRVRVNNLPGWLIQMIKPIVPNFNWILIKPKFDTAIPSNAYTQDYFMNHCDGHQEFQLNQSSLPSRLSRPVAIPQITAGQRILEVGSGRGEIVHYCTRHGAQAWGIDYAREALNIAKGELRAYQQADAQHLPFGEDYFDTVFMLDIVEHLNPAQLQKSLAEVWRVLRPGGQLIIHTMPNLWYYRYGYPLNRAVQRLRGQNLPNNPKERWQFAHLHINEQTPTTLKQALDSANFKSRVWLENVQSYQQENNPLVKQTMTLLAGRWPFKLIFCNDIFARAIK